jgi:hypothetical protein
LRNSVISNDLPSVVSIHEKQIIVFGNGAECLIVSC